MPRRIAQRGVDEQAALVLPLLTDFLQMLQVVPVGPSLVKELHAADACLDLFMLGIGNVENKQAEMNQ